MSTSSKYLLLALAAYQAKKFEEAGALFAQAAESEDAVKLSEDLESLEGSDPDVAADDGLAEDDRLPSIFEDNSSDDFEEDEDLDFGEQEESTSSVSRRQVRSLHQIGKILAASMEATASEDVSADEDEDEGDFEPDPDLPGETLIPASFSSVRVVGMVSHSPVKLKQ